MASPEDLDLSRFISGVYNYCDRWCEQCRFNDRCLVYYREQERNLRHQLAGEDPRDWDVVLNDVGESFQETLGMLQQMADEMGLEVEPEDEEDDDPIPDHRDDPLYGQAEEFSVRLQKLLDGVREEMPSIGDDLAARYSEESEDTPAGREVLETLQGVLDAYELLCRYCFFIPVKTARAVSSLPRLSRIKNVEQYDLDDGRGTAKLVHVSLGRMIPALWRLAEFHRPWFETAVGLANEAESLRRQIDETFPTHQDFHRPGFDDEPEE